MVLYLKRKLIYIQLREHRNTEVINVAQVQNFMAIPQSFSFLSVIWSKYYQYSSQKRGKILPMKKNFTLPYSLKQATPKLHIS